MSSKESDMPTGKCLILVTPDAKRTMSSMLGVSAFLATSDIKFDVIDDSKIFYIEGYMVTSCLLYTSPSPRDRLLSRMPSSA